MTDHRRVEITVDPILGNIRAGEIYLDNLGSVLNVWARHGVDLSPADARALAAALIAWADRAERGGQTDLLGGAS